MFPSKNLFHIYILLSILRASHFHYYVLTSDIDILTLRARCQPSVPREKKFFLKVFTVSTNTGRQSKRQSHMNRNRHTLQFLVVGGGVDWGLLIAAGVGVKMKIIHR